MHLGDIVMADEAGAKNWFQTLPGFLTALAAFLTALTGIIAALSGMWAAMGTKAPATNGCIDGYVWRQAYPGDHVCVTQETYLKTQQDNQLGPSRRQRGGGAYGPDTCETGFVWREALKGDLICVTPETRAQVIRDNSQTSARIKR